MKITVVFEFNEEWDDYEYDCPEFIMEYAIECKDGVGYTIKETI